MVAASIYISLERQEAIDFTYPFYYDYTGGLYRKMNTNTKVFYKGGFKEYF